MARREWQNPSVLERDTAHGRVWYIRFRRKVWGQKKRKEEWRELGLCAKITKRQAEREKDKILRDINNPTTVKAQIPMSVFLKQYRELHIPTLSEPSQRTYLQHLHAYIEPALGSIALGSVGPMEIERIFRGMEQAGLSRNTRSTTRGILRSIWGCARRWKYTDESPLRDVDVGGGPRRVRECRVPSLDEVRRLMESCEGDVPLLIEALYTTGMRISEAAGLLVSDLDFVLGFVSIARRDCRGSVGETKSDAGTRDLPLGHLSAALQTHVAGKAPGDRVFTWRGEPIVDNTLLANYLSPIMVALGIKFPGFGWHTFRRLHLSLMSKSVSIFDLRQQAGHASVTTTQRYITDDKAARTEAANALPFLVNKGKKSA